MQGWRGWAIVSLVVLGAGCGSDPVPLTGLAQWSEGCEARSAVPCSAGRHTVRGSNGSPAVVVNCGVRPVPGGTRIFFQIAAVDGMQNFEESTEALFASGVLGAVGGELRTEGEERGFVQMRGLGWAVINASVGAMNNCHVVITRLVGQDFDGRISCSGITDDLTPPRTRFITGVPGQTTELPGTTNNPGQFSFTNCDPR